MIGRVTDSMQNAGADPVVVVTGYQAERLKAHLCEYYEPQFSPRRKILLNYLYSSISCLSALRF